MLNGMTTPLPFCRKLVFCKQRTSLYTQHSNYVRKIECFKISNNLTWYMPCILLYVRKYITIILQKIFINDSLNILDKIPRFSSRDGKFFLWKYIIFLPWNTIECLSHANVRNTTKASNKMNVTWIGVKMNKDLLDMQISKQWSQKTSMIIDDASRCAAFQRKKCTFFPRKNTSTGFHLRYIITCVDVIKDFNQIILVSSLVLLHL